MRLGGLIAACCWATALQSVWAADIELLVPSQDAPTYQLSNLRTELDATGNQVLSFDFKRTRQGTGTVLVQGKSARGHISIAAPVSSLAESGTMQLKSLFPSRGERINDIELFLVQMHDWGDGETRYAVVSNSLRIGNPGAPVEPRKWTAEEQSKYENYKRVMADDRAHKPRKSYPVTIDVPDDSRFLPQEAKVAAGTPLRACYSGEWHPLTTLSENEDGSINVRWDAYGATYDCSMPREELIVNKAFLIESPTTRSLTTLSRTEIEERGLEQVPPKPLKRYAVTIAVPDHSEVVPRDLNLPRGTKLQACYAGKWNPITALSQNKDGSVNVRWDDYGEAYDCSMVRDELIIRKTALRKLRDASASGSNSRRPPEVRTWTDATGKYTVRASLVRKTEASVTLRTESGREVTLPMAKLSEADREFLRAADATATDDRE